MKNEAAQRLFSEEIRRGLNTDVIGNTLLSFDELDSTNDTAYRLGEQGVEEGLCVFAEFQRKGRGRLGRSWASPKGKNLLFSILLRPVLTPAEVSRITLVAAVSMAKTLEDVAGKKLGIKWPNDIVYEEKKVCGILTEMSAEADRVRFVVVGIGLNVNSDPSELPPGSTSLKKITGAAVDRAEIARSFLTHFESDYATLKKGSFLQTVEEWESYSVTTGQRVIATVLGRKVQGQAAGIDEDGALWIRKDNGIQQRITAGDIQHLRSQPERKAGE